MKQLVIAVLSVATAASAETPPGWSAPPLVPAGAPAVPPPPPSPALTPSDELAPAASGLPPSAKEPPAPEVGLMVSESLFGMLTAAGVTVLPYFLLFGSGQLVSDPTINSVVFVLIFSTVPLAVAQTQVSLANSSRHYLSETWPAALAGLAGQAAVLGLYYATGWLPRAQVSGGTPATGGSLAALMVGAIAVVPLLQMAVINLTKQPRAGAISALRYSREGGLALGVPLPSPIVMPTARSVDLGVQISLLNARW